MIEVSLRPYPGKVFVCESRKAYKAAYKKLFGEKHPSDLKGNKGRMDGKYRPDKGPVYLVWGESHAYLAHELSHVILHVFELAGIDPREACGEPFCYMLSQLLLDCEAAK